MTESQSATQAAAVFRVLVADRLGQPGLDRLVDEPTVDVDVRTGLTEQDLAAIIGDYDGLIVRSGTRVTAGILEAGDRLRVVGRAGIGVDNVDLDTATRRGIVVMNTPQANTIATAEHALAMLLAVCRHTAPAHASLLAGQWERSAFTGIQLYRKTLGLIGLGKIARHVARRAQGFGMTVIACDPYVSPEVAEQEKVKLVGLDDLLSGSDIISLHTSLSPDTENLIDDRALAKCRDGVILVNPSRGRLVDEHALARAIASGKVSRAAVDVYRTEPPDENCPLIGLSGVLHTPHLGASTREAQRDVAVQIADQVIDALNERDFRNSVNMPFDIGPDFRRVEPYLKLAAKIGALHFHMADAALEAIDIELKGERVSDLARPIATGLLKGYLECFLPESVNYVNAPALASGQGIRVSQSRDLSAMDYANLVTVKASWRGGERTISGTLLSGRYPRILEVSRYHLDVDPSGIMLVMVNDDTPGVIGKVGTILADDRVNIAEWRLGRSLEERMALAFVQLDSEPSAAALGRLNDIDAIKKLKVIHL